MSSKDRIQRLHERNRRNILMVSCEILKTGGWPALNMRKIAEKIDYTAPMIYSYFSDKNALISELAKIGFLLLTKRINLARDKSDTPAVQIQSMWLAYWNFAFEEKSLYQAMFGVEMTASKNLEGIDALGTLFSEIIAELNGNQQLTEAVVCMEFYRYWSAVHGIIAIRLVHERLPELNDFLLLKMVINDIITVYSAVPSKLGAESSS